MLFFTSGSEGMRIDSSGRLLVGTSSSQAHASANLVEIGNYTLTNAGITINSPTNGAGLINFGDSSSSNRRGRIEYNHTADAFRLYTADSERMRIDSSGNVGIGNTSPSQPLDVTGWVKTSVGLLGTYGRVGLGNSGGPEITTGALANPIKFIGGNGSSNLERMRVDGSGRLLVGTSSGNDTGSESNLVIESNSSSDSSYGGLMLRRGSTSIGSGTSLGRMYFADQNGNTGARISGLADGTWATNDYPGVITFDTTADGASSFTERMRIDNAGNVGIGHNSPASLLTVGGDAITTAKPTVSIAPSSGNGSITIRGGSPTLSFDQTGGGDGTIIYDSSSELLFKNGTLDSSTERMRMDSSGRLLVGST